jgi:outer membrane immunogenic protein
MKKFALAFSLVGFAGSALAADLPVYQAPPPVVPVYSWTGCFFGGNAGGVWIRKEYNTVAGTNLGSHDANSWLAGVQAGCDYQFAGGFVIGIQGDYDWMSASGSHVDFTGVTHAHTTKSLASVTGRLGYAWDRFLLYMRGGWAWERDNYASAVPPFPGILAAPVPGFTVFAGETRGGWVLGVGGEYAFTNFMSGFIEYDYYDFGTRAVNFPTPLNIPVVFRFDIRERKSVVKVGFNFRFGGGPVVARH